MKKGYKCHCGKSYKTAQGLKNHANIQHVYSHTTTATTTTSGDIQQNNLVETVPRTVAAVKQHHQQQVHGGSVKPAKTDPKTIEAIKLKSIVESNKKLLAAKVQQKITSAEENDVCLLTPATSPESLSLTQHSLVDYKQNIICDIRNSNN